MIRVHRSLEHAPTGFYRVWSDDSGSVYRGPFASWGSANAPNSRDPTVVIVMHHHPPKQQQEQQR